MLKIHGHRWKSKKKKNQEWWTTKVAPVIREKKEAWKVSGNIKVNATHPAGGVAFIWTE